MTRRRVRIGGRRGALPRLAAPAVALALALCGPAAVAGPVLVNGAGATFPYPLYARWFAEYHKLRPEYRFNYQSIGSGGGIQQIIDHTVDFGASDAPMSDAELARAPTVQHLPLVIGAVAVVYSGLPDGVRLDPGTLAGVFLGEITRWSDPRLAALNPQLALPDEPITVVHRSDGSGTTRLLTEYLDKVSPDWHARVGTGKSVRWPAGVGMKGNEGVTGMVKSLPFALGYVELAYARQSRLPVAALRNGAGEFVRPSQENMVSAARAVPLPPDLRVSLTDVSAPGAYPLVAFSYLLVDGVHLRRDTAEALAAFLWWAVHDGQKLAPPLDYAPLPPSVVSAVERAIERLRAGAAAAGAP